jgi:hypothetical protein
VPTRIYHWKHGWIPLDHSAAISKAKGSELSARRYLARSHTAGHAHASVVAGEYGGGTHIRGLQPVAADHLRRDSRILTAFNPGSRQFALHDPVGSLGNGHRAPVSSAIPEHLAEHFNARGHHITRVEHHDGTVKVRVRTRNGDSKLYNADGSDAMIVDAPPKPTAAPVAAGGLPPGVTETHTVQPSSAGSRRYMVLRPATRGASIETIDYGLGQHLTGNDLKVIGYNRRVVTTVDSTGVVRKFKADGSNIDKPVISKLANTGTGGQFKRQDIGHWQHVPAHEAIPQDGSIGGQLSAQKIRRAYVQGDHRVLIETPLTQAQTEAFLGHVDTALTAAGHHIDHPVTFHVPAGDATFRQSGRTRTLAYVYRGDTTRVHVSPVIARGETVGAAGDAGGTYMHAANDVHPTAYTLTHELGHIVDNKHQHTKAKSSFAALGREHVTHDANVDEHAFHREHRAHLSRYGGANAAEGYAEAFAQHRLGRRGSHPNDVIAQEYARRYGWR